MEIETIRRNLKDMLEARGDDVTFIEEHGDVVEVSRYYSEIIVLDTDRTTVFFVLSKDKFKEWKGRPEHDNAESMVDAYKMKNFLLILVEGHVSPAVLTQLQARDKALQALGGCLQIFYTKELMYNPLKHVLVPKHEKMSEEDVKEMMDAYMVKHRSQLPIISRNDVIARWLGLKHGDIVRITRHNDTSGIYYYYRCCV